jgi:hypothetical protein
MQLLNKLVLVFILFIFSSTSFGQKPFLSINYTTALELAKKQGKLLLIQFEAVGTCNQCNEVGKIQMQHKEVKDKIESQFIAIYVNQTDPLRKTLQQLYEFENESFGTLFTDADGNLIHTHYNTSTNQKKIVEAMDVAIQKSGENLHLTTIANIYAKEPTISNLKMLILKREELNFSIDSLLDIYTSLIENNSNTSHEAFIIQRAPILKSKSSNFCRSSKAFDSIWYTMPLNNRIQLNNRIIYKSRLKAIKEKNQKFAADISVFIIQIHNDAKDARVPIIRAFEHMNNYYYAVSDTISYMRNTKIMLNNYLMTIDVDSIKKIDEKQMEIVLKNNKPKDSSIIIGNKKVFAKVVAYNYVQQYYSNYINDAAWYFYTKTKDNATLQMALSWAERSCQFYETTANLDTYARLNYVLGNKEKALQLMEKSKNLSEKIKNGMHFHQDVFLKMQANEAKIDAY